MPLDYTLLISPEGDEFITAYVGGRVHLARNDHPRWESIKKGCEEGDASVVDLFDPAVLVERRFRRLSDRVSVRGGKVYFDGDEVDNSLTKQIISFIDSGIEDWKPLVAFFEKVMSNPQEHSREQLYRWLKTHDFTITTEGDIVAYKGVLHPRSGDSKFPYESSNSGRAIVDGEVFGDENAVRIPQAIGSIIEMPRSEVRHDPRQSCATGLHVATFSFAESFTGGEPTLEVHVNPRDVVSVPTDEHDQKMRVCRYRVIREVTEPHTEPIIDVSDDEPEQDSLDPSLIKQKGNGRWTHPALDKDYAIKGAVTQALNRKAKAA